MGIDRLTDQLTDQPTVVRLLTGRFSMKSTVADVADIQSHVKMC